MYVLQTFELEALQVLSHEQKEVMYVLPSQKPIYKAISPILLQNYTVAEYITRTTWQQLSRNDEGSLTLAPESGTLLYVPRYLGSTLSAEEVKGLGLKKIFDNSNIAIYKK